MLVAVTCVVEVMFKDLALPPRKTSVFSVLLEDVVFAIGILAVAIPEGLPLVPAISLASLVHLIPNFGSPDQHETMATPRGSTKR